MYNKPSTPKHRYLHVMVTKFLIVLNKIGVPDQEEDAMLDILEDGHVEGSSDERGNHLIHPFDPNIDAMKKHETIASRQNYFENVGFNQYVFKNAGIVFCDREVNWVITVCASKKSQNKKVRHRVRKNIGRLPVNNCFIIWALPFWMNRSIVAIHGYIIFFYRN